MFVLSEICIIQNEQDPYADIKEMHSHADLFIADGVYSQPHGHRSLLAVRSARLAITTWAMYGLDATTYSATLLAVRTERLAIVASMTCGHGLGARGCGCSSRAHIIHSDAGKRSEHPKFYPLCTVHPCQGNLQICTKCDCIIEILLICIAMPLAFSSCGFEHFQLRERCLFFRPKSKFSSQVKT